MINHDEPRVHIVDYSSFGRNYSNGTIGCHGMMHYAVYSRTCRRRGLLQLSAKYIASDVCGFSYTTVITGVRKETSSFHHAAATRPLISFELRRGR
jgi:hypothetical protein